MEILCRNVASLSTHCFIFMLYFRVYGVWSMVVGNDGQSPVIGSTSADANLRDRNLANRHRAYEFGVRFV